MKICRTCNTCQRDDQFISEGARGGTTTACRTCLDKRKKNTAGLNTTALELVQRTTRSPSFVAISTTRRDSAYKDRMKLRQAQHTSGLFLHLSGEYLTPLRDYAWCGSAQQLRNVCYKFKHNRDEFSMIHLGARIDD